MSVTCAVSIPFLYYGGTYLTTSSIMRMGDTVSTVDPVTTLALGVEITYSMNKKLTSALGVGERNSYFKCSRMK